MGYSLAWMAVKGKSPQVVREELGFRETGEREELPESELTATELSNGWYLIVSNRNERVVGDDELQQLSSNCEIATCFVEEHVMCSYATAWKNGHRCWSIFHNGQHQPNNLETSGVLPPEFNSILSSMQTKQSEADSGREGVDYIFEVPVELAKNIAGYRHDREIPGLADKPFAVLAGGFPVPGRVYSPFERLSQKWMALAGWQRGVFGTLFILGLIFAIVVLVTFVVMRLT